jgi:hypothetical protein
MSFPPTEIDANGIQVITADNNGSVSIGPTGIVLKEGLLTPPLITGEIGYAGFSTTNPLGIQFISPINLNNQDIFSVNEITATTFVGSLSGNATSATSATTATSATYSLFNTFSYFTDFNSADSGDFTWNSSGAGTASIFNGTFDASLSSVGLSRSGLLNLNSTASPSTNLNIYYQSENATWCPKFLNQLVFGFIPLGNGSLTTVGTEAGNINQAFGIALGNSATDTQATSLLWRLSSASATIPTWQLVENNVVKETLTGDNLTGGLTNKWCRAIIQITNNGTQFYGVFTNLTDNVSYTTATYDLTSPNTFCQIYFHSGTQNNTAKQIAFDYCLASTNCLNINVSDDVSTSR